MYTIDKEYLKTLKKRLNAERDVLNEGLSKDCTIEQFESLTAKRFCITRLICNVQDIINDMTLLELAEQVDKK